MGRLFNAEPEHARLPDERRHASSGRKGGLILLEAAMADDRRDVIEILTHDHREVETPGDKLLGPVAGLVDRVRDAVTGRGTSG